MTKRTIMFSFYGRRANVELQMPFIHRILADNPTVEFHAWNLAKDRDDFDYITNLRIPMEFRKRLKVIHDFWGTNPWERFNDVYRHYAQPKYKGVRFVKLDDDVVFIQTKTFGDFIEAVDANPHAVISANVINNGACMALDKTQRSEFQRLRMRQLNVHLSAEFAEMSHNFFLAYWQQVVERKVQWLPTQDWLSINFIGYDYDMGRRFANLLETQAPPVIAGRHFRGRDKLGDEGMVNTLPRIIVNGFTVAHLTFGPQERKRPDMFNELRKRYAEVNKEYLKR